VIAGNAPATVMIRPVPLLCPSKRQVLRHGMSEWEPGIEDDGDLEDADTDGSEPAS
jgi:hypothetical protein